MRENNSLQITGLGVQSSIGLGIPAFSAALRAGLCRIQQTMAYPELQFPLLIGSISEFVPCNSLSSVVKNQFISFMRRLPYEIQITLTAAIEAWYDAGFFTCVPPSERIGLVVTGDSLLPYLNYKYYQSFAKAPDYLSPKAVLECFDSHYLGVISEALKIKGPGYLVGGASASGNVALIQAYQMMQQENLDACLVVGAFMRLSPVAIQAFYNTGVLGGATFVNDPTAASRPFDQKHEGFILGEASGALILEKSSDKKSYAKFLGGVIRLSGTQYAEPDYATEVRVMQDALTHAELSLEKITYLNTHGTSSVLGDETEIKAIRECFGGHLSHVWLNATKSLTGHSLNSAGIIEAITSAIQLKEHFLHPNINLETPIDTACQFVGKKVLENKKVQYALSNSFGFSGIHSAIILAED